MSQQALLQQEQVQYPPSIPAPQPGRLLRRRPEGIEAGLAVIALAALVLSLALAYAAESAVCTRNGYAGITLRREIEDLRAQNSLLRYQINLSESNYRVEQVASRLQLRPADAIREVDYVVLPSSDREEMGRADRSTGVIAALAAAGGQAEASTGKGHRS
jgi:cytochrome c oxidase assembly protein Cox11